MRRRLFGLSLLLLTLALAAAVPAAAEETVAGSTPQPVAAAVSTRIYLPLQLGASQTPAPPATSGAHATIKRYDGPQTCVACHGEQANDALHSEHIQWAGKWQQVNTYCTAPAPADFACLSCHGTTGKVTNLTVNDVDCLMCHQDQYQRSLAPLNIPVTVVDWTGTTRTYMTPSKNAQGEYQMAPRFDLMPPGTTMEKLAQTVHLPTRATCLRCHAKAGGSDGAKRGDLSTVSANPPRASDVHLSPQGADMTCQDCHKTENHQIPGRGIDLRISEGTVTCDGACHSNRPHESSQLNTHTARVACQTCHIPRFGKDMPTEMSRDWTQPVWSAAGCQGQGAWVGHEVKAGNVKPGYTFWNGSSYVYDLKNPIQADPGGTFTMSRALGGINDAGSKLYPIKVHTAVQPRHNESGRMVQYDVLTNFMTGFFEQAARRGLEYMKLAGSYSWVKTRAEQLITHGVGPKETALQCAACHSDRTQMDLRTLGYTLKGTASQTCTQCHGAKESKPLDVIHTKHVTDKRYDCSWCHTFSRPERGLRLP